MEPAAPLFLLTPQQHQNYKARNLLPDEFGLVEDPSVTTSGSGSDDGELVKVIRCETQAQRAHVKFLISSS